jgi:hypothetical protein
MSSLFLLLLYVPGPGVFMKVAFVKGALSSFLHMSPLVVELRKGFALIELD